MSGGGRHSRVDVKILTPSLIFGFLRSPFVHFIHQKLYSVKKIFFWPPLNVDANFFCPPKIRRKFSRRARTRVKRNTRIAFQILIICTSPLSFNDYNSTNNLLPRKCKDFNWKVFHRKVKVNTGMRLEIMNLSTLLSCIKTI